MTFSPHYFLASSLFPVERQHLLFGIRERGASERMALGFELDFIWLWLLDRCIGQFAEAGFITAHL
jgi:hypothetical protein